MSFFAWVKKHWLVLFGTIAVALFTGLPSVVFFQSIGDDFRGLYPVFNGDALYYHARIQDMHDGHFSLNHQYFFEHKDTAFADGVGADYIIYAITALFNISNPALQVILDFLFPALIFVLTYLLFKRFSRNKYTAALLPLVVYTFAMGGSLLKPMRPQIVLPILLLFLLSWAVLAIKEDKKVFRGLLAGALLGALILSYYYFWSFAVVVIGLYALVLIMRKSYRELRFHGLMAGLGALIGLPYVIRVLHSLDAPFHADVAVRIGVYYSHLPESYPRLVVALVWLGFFVWFARRYKVEQETKAHLIAVLLIANVLYPNHQLVTGIIIENALHWSWMPILIFAVSAHYMVGVLGRNRIAWNKHGAILAAILFLFALPAWRLHTFNWNKYARLYEPNFALEHQYYADVFDWISANAEKDDVIYSDKELMSYIPAYTAANVYNSAYAFVLPASDQEIIERTLLSHFFEPDYFNEKGFGFNAGGRMLWFFQEESEKNTHSILGRWNIPYESQYPAQKEREKVEGVYRELLQQGWDVGLLKRYRVDYIMWDTREHPEWNLESYPGLEFVDTIGDVRIYTIV